MQRTGGSHVQTPEYSKTRESGIELIEHFCWELSDVACEQRFFLTNNHM